MAGAERAPRTEHPFHMYDAIHAQPAAFALAARRADEPARHFALRVAGRRRLFLVGTGTSYHAAEIGEHLLRSRPGAPEPRAVRAFDFALYGPRLSSEDAVVVVSHRGTKRYSRASLERARAAGCATALVTGEGGGSDEDADVVLRTVAQESSSAHTVSFTGAVAALAVLALHLGPEAGGAESGAGARLAEEVSAVLDAALGTEPEAEVLARAHADRRRIWLAGAGPASTVAREIALKIKETSYGQAEGMATETMLHGPLQCVEAEDLFVLVAPEGPGRERTTELAGAIAEIGAPYVAVGDGSPEALARGAAARIDVPSLGRLPEPLAAFVCAVPLQLLTYHLALVRGTDPDGFRLEDPRFAKASARVEL